MNKWRIKVFLYQPDFPHNDFYSQTKRVLYISNVVCVVQCLCFLSKFDLKEGEFTKQYSGSHLRYKICGGFLRHSGDPVAIVIRPSWCVSFKTTRPIATLFLCLNHFINKRNQKIQIVIFLKTLKTLPLPNLGFLFSAKY